MGKIVLMRGLAVMCVLLALAGPAAAHDPRARVLPSVTVEFRFSDGSPMDFATAQIFGPGDTIPAFETTTDRNGRVSFVADRDGVWRVQNSDRDGHAITTSVSISGGAPTAPGRGIPDWIVAVSLVLNVILISRLFTRRRTRTG